MTTSDRLAKLIEIARHYVMSPQEVFEQRVSFVFAQQDWSGGHQMSKDEVRDRLKGIYGIPGDGGSGF